MSLSIDTLILFSGGIDSTALLWRERARVRHALFVDYGQPAAAAEAAAASRIASRLEVPLERRALELDAPMDRGPSVVPGRNACLLTLGLHVSLRTGCTRVVYGAMVEDHATYADCRPEFVEAAARLMALEGLELEAPNLNLSKAELVAQCQRAGLLELTCSCYVPRADGAPCHACVSCLQARRAGAVG